MKRVVVGLSGGVDSSVAAYLLKEQGYDVVGLFMINWHDTEGTLSGDCPWHDDRMFAELVAKRLDIPFNVVDLSGQYRARVVDYIFSEYGSGRTPNPDVLCNREIKFDAFLEEALKLGADYIATGHYCRCEREEGYYRLLAGTDRNKDQSYFLCRLSQAQLSKALFPIGRMEKPEVRAIAERERLATAKRRDSQGICFVGKVDLPLFLQQRLEAKQGDIIEILPSWEGYGKPLAHPWDTYGYMPEEGRKIGEHRGAWFHTIGQRKGLGIGGYSEPLFIIATDVERNIIYAGEGEAHPGLNRRGLFIRAEDLHWVRPDRELERGGSCRFGIRIRYRQPLQGGILHREADGVCIEFDTLQRGIAPGQFAAWYDGEELIGSGVIA